MYIIKNELLILLFLGVFQYEAVIEIPAEFFNDEAARRKRQDSTRGIDSLIAKVRFFEILQTNHYGPFCLDQRLFIR